MPVTVAVLTDVAASPIAEYWLVRAPPELTVNEPVPLAPIVKFVELFHCELAPEMVTMPFDPRPKPT